MKGTVAEFVVEKRNGVVKSVSTSVVYTPKVNVSGGGIKWFDDSKLLKAPKQN